eukprot:TRINITY_DN49748_c0_g1_i1.p1 TRINITY_DN49748_c0_g1~~TRINITY_DN49748_c0_g1_i1.p1  ORF type:complete len:433 (+),score=121.69 TRINITY_DN49748_c0_g1_i1:59-1357(+)
MASVDPAASFVAPVAVAPHGLPLQRPVPAAASAGGRTVPHAQDGANGTQGWATSSVVASAVLAGAVAAGTRPPRRQQQRQRCKVRAPTSLAVMDAKAEGGEQASCSKGSTTTGRLVRYLDRAGFVSVRAIEATDLIRETVERHNASPIVSIALGRALLGVTLMASGRDPGESLQLRIGGEGPCGAIIAEANSKLQIRGFVGEAQADAATVPELVLAEGGTGLLRVTRTHPFWKQPYSGTVAMDSGEIAEDIVQYLAKSEQTPASMGLSVEWDTENNRVKHAEGWLVTLLPGWDDSFVNVLEANIGNFGRMEASDKPRPEAICEHMMRELDGSFQMKEEASFRCNCSEDRLLTAVMLLGKMEVLRILKAKENVEARCEWCGNNMVVSPEQVREHMNSEEGKEEVDMKAASPRQLKLQEEELQNMPEPGTADWS